MNRIETIIASKLTPNVFYLVSFFILTIPVVVSFDFLMYGARTEGKAIGTYLMGNGKTGRYCTALEFRVESKVYRFWGPAGVLFKDGEVVEVIYMKANPKEAYLGRPLYLYFKSSSVVSFCIVLIIFWISIFFTLGKKY